MRVKKVFNQSTVLVDDGGQEKVAIGKGIRFDRKRNDLIFDHDAERIFVMEPEDQIKLQNLLNQIDERFLFVAETIIDHAETVLMEKLNEHILIALTDYIAFSAENTNDGIVIHNKLLREIEMLYSDGFNIVQWAIEYLAKELGIPCTYDEAGYIAIHIHSGRSGRNSNHRSIREVTIISNIIHLVEPELETDIHSEPFSLNYSGLVNHLRLLLQRIHVQRYAVLDTEIVEMVRRKYPESYRISKKIRVLLTKEYQLAITKEELGYLAIHIERLRSAIVQVNVNNHEEEKN